MKYITVATILSVILILSAFVYFILIKKQTDQIISGAVDKLTSIKDRIKNLEKYRSEDNTGLTVVGTVLEQAVDIIIAVLKQDLVTEAISKTIRNKKDADEIAEYIELLGAEIVNEIKNIPLLRCAKPGKMECKNISRERRDSGKSEINTVSVCEYVEDETAEEKTSDCDKYVPNRDTMNILVPKAMKKLIEKVASIVKDPVEQDKLYRIAKNIGIDNYIQYTISSGQEIDQSLIDSFPTKDEFIGYLNTGLAEIETRSKMA